MKKLHIYAVVVALAIATLGTVTWSKTYANNGNSSANKIVGVWFVHAPDAPFAYHMFAFNADGNMEQANPDAGNPFTSDSDGKGIWVKDGNKIEGKFVEVTADRTTHQFASRGEISFELEVDGDTFAGTASANFYDLDNNLIRGPLTTPITGQRVTLP
jgi:hypothetical protein